MKLLVALALFIFAVAEANHDHAHTLRGQRFKAGNTYIYKLDLNVTAGVLGLSSQVSASVLQADVKIYAETDTNLVLKIENVKVSGSVAAIEHKFGNILLHEASKLEDRLSASINFVFENGAVKSYTLSKKDNLESTKIKKSILRSLEMYIPENVLKEMENPLHKHHPVMYNTTENTDFGAHITNYIITTSPDAGYPEVSLIYNISRFDDCQGEYYPAYKLHHNFHKQGCPEVCRQSEGWKDNQYGAGCPSGFEPHQSPMKRSFTKQHSLRSIYETLTPEIITSSETHLAKMYDQDMEVQIRYKMEMIEVEKEEILNSESGQKTYTDLDKMDLEINEDEINRLCNYKQSDEAIQSARNLLETIADLLIAGETSSPVGEKVLLLREVLASLKLNEFEEIAKDITNLDYIQHDQVENSIQRQIWLEILPLIGTAESVKFLVKYITDQVLIENNMLIWEATEILESLPDNIMRPDEETIIEMQKLLDDTALLSKSNLLHSAVHLCVGRIIGKVCGNVPLLHHKKPTETQKFLHTVFPENNGPPKCPEDRVLQIIQKISNKLKTTKRPDEIAVYVDTLTNTGMQQALREVSDYVHGDAKNMQRFSSKLVTFIRTAALQNLHNIVGRHPTEVLEMVLPIYFNDTETPKIRNAAFSVLMRCQPSVGVLQKVASFSWFERSREVGSYVTSTLETYGNSSMPCMQLLSDRIKEILPQVKKFDVGYQHAKNHMWTYFDAVRQFGLEGRIMYTPNNESIIPSTLFHSLSRSIDSLRDTVYQGNIIIEGLTQTTILEQFIEYLNVRNIQPIKRDYDVFGPGKKGSKFIEPRSVEDLRMVAYLKFFYKSYFFYLDASTFEHAMEEFSKVFRTYLKKRHSKYDGHLVKVFLPSSYHTTAVATTLPYPVEFVMTQPIVLSLKLETDDSMPYPPSLKKFDFHLKPSIYISNIITHQLKNLGDCKEVGVYHVHKIGVTYPFQIKYNAITFPNITFKYKVPETPKKVLHYLTESGTYAGRKELETLPMDEKKKPIRTLPTPFKFVKEGNLVGVPPFRMEIFTEDMNLFRQPLPRTSSELLDMAVRRILNTGWRYKSANLILLEDRALWTGDNEATFKITYSRNHVPRAHVPCSACNEDDEDDDVKKAESNEWSKYMEISEEEELDKFTENAKAASSMINFKFPHISHRLEISVSAEPLSSKAYIILNYNHTYDKNCHTLHLQGFSKAASDTKPYRVNIYHVMGYFNKPDELQYDQDFGKQLATFRTAIDWSPVDESPCCIHWDKIQLAVCGMLKYESNKNILERELWEAVKDKYYSPETRDQCLADINDENPLSTNCIKAIREHSAFNRIETVALWNKELPKWITQFAMQTDVYLKYLFFNHLELTAENNSKKNRIHMNLKYINKFVDNPVADLEVRRSSEKMVLRRIPVKVIQPLSSLYEMHENVLLQASNNTYPASCVLSENYVQTYDLVTYPFKPKKCHYVLSSHCTKTKNFAILLYGSQEIHIYVASTRLVLSPKKDTLPGYVVQHDGKNVRVVHPVIFNEKSEIYAYIESERFYQIRVVAKRAGISVLYNGKTVKIEVSLRYKGELCGLCSEFDGEELGEFKGMDKCLYRDHVNFAESALVRRSKKCTPNPNPDRICEDFMYRGSFPDRHTSDPTDRRTAMVRNKVIRVEDKVCFSEEPLLFCGENVKPSVEKKEEVTFRCLPENEETNGLIEEARWKPLDLPTEFEYRVQTVDVPDTC